MMVIVAIIVSIIINFLISATIRKQRRELGIEKAMGYTTADIKKQMVFRIIPIAIPALIIGGLITIPLINIFMEYAFGLAMDVRLIILVPTMLVMALYIYASAYISAGKVKKISVTELMTE
jgi:ABC-type antimicrobial peptide transport system permease subunit